MRIEQANSIAMSEILTQLGIIQKEDKDFSDENIIQSVCEYLKHNNENHTINDAVRWIKNMTGNTHVINSIKVPENYEQDSEAKLTRKKPTLITKISLIHYLESRGIPLSLANKFAREVNVKNKHTGKISTCIGSRNEEGGYYLRAYGLKGSTSQKGITFIRGDIPKPDDIHIFRTFMDFLSALAILKIPNLKGDAIILNSMNQLQNATPYIKYYGYRNAYSYMSNDEIGRKAVEAISVFAKLEQGLIHKPLNKAYMTFKDVNQWHVSNLSALS